MRLQARKRDRRDCRIGRPDSRVSWRGRPKRRPAANRGRNRHPQSTDMLSMRGQHSWESGKSLYRNPWIAMSSLERAHLVSGSCRIPQWVRCSSADWLSWTQESSSGTHKTNSMIRQHRSFMDCNQRSLWPHAILYRRFRRLLLRILFYPDGFYLATINIDYDKVMPAASIQYLHSPIQPSLMDRNRVVVAWSCPPDKRLRGYSQSGRPKPPCRRFSKTRPRSPAGFGGTRGPSQWWLGILPSGNR